MCLFIQQVGGDFAKHAGDIAGKALAGDKKVVKWLSMI